MSIFSSATSERAHQTRLAKYNKSLNISVSISRLSNIIFCVLNTIRPSGMLRTKIIPKLKELYDWCETEQEPGASIAKALKNTSRAQRGRYVIRYIAPRTADVPSSSTRSQVGPSTCRLIDPAPQNLNFMNSAPNCTFADLFPVTIQKIFFNKALSFKLAIFILVRRSFPDKVLK